MDYSILIMGKQKKGKNRRYRLWKIWGKINIEVKKDWKIEYISICDNQYNTKKVKNKSNVKLGTGSTLVIRVRNKKTKKLDQIQFDYSDNKYESENFYRTHTLGQ